MSNEDSSAVAVDGNCHVICPSCDGGKTTTAVFVRYAPSHNGAPVRQLPCHVCGGCGHVASDQIARMNRGRCFRRYRVDVLSLGLREAANKWGMKASELSCIEQGKTETEWTPPGWAD